MKPRELITGGVHSSEAQEFEDVLGRLPRTRLLIPTHFSTLVL